MVLSRSIYSFICQAIIGLAFAAILLSVSANAQQVELLDFYLPTCGPCHAMAPTVDRLAGEGVAVKKVDGSRDVSLASHMRVSSYPTFIAVVDGKEIDRIVGGTNYGGLRSLVDKAYAQANAAKPKVQPTSFESQSTSVKSSALADRLLASSARIVVDDPAGRAFGTGTIIDARQGEALLATCAHLFKDAQGNLLQTDGRITLELFNSNSSRVSIKERVPGRLVSYDFKADVALVSFRPDSKVEPIRVVSSPATVTEGTAVCSVGCDLGADPTVRNSQVVSLNRYLGAPNIETTGAPVQGRSGGGLFNSSGELIGICFAADEELDEGLYVGIAEIHSELDRVGLTSLYQQVPGAPGEPALQQEQPLLANNSVPSNKMFVSQMEPVASTSAHSVEATDNSWPEPVIRGQNAMVSEAVTSLTPVEQSTMEEVVRQAADSEVVLMIRPKTPNGQTEVLTLDSSSPEFVAMLRKISKSGVK